MVHFGSMRGTCLYCKSEQIMVANLRHTGLHPSLQAVTLCAECLRMIAQAVDQATVRAILEKITLRGAIVIDTYYPRREK